LHGNQTTVWNAMIQPHPRKQNQKRCPSSQTIAIVLWGVEHLPQRGPSSFLLIILRCSRIFIVHYVIYPGKKKESCSVAPHGPTLLICVFGEDSEEWLGTSPHSPYSVGIGPSDYHLFRFVKGNI